MTIMNDVLRVSQLVKTTCFSLSFSLFAISIILLLHDAFFDMFSL